MTPSVPLAGPKFSFRFFSILLLLPTPTQFFSNIPVNKFRGLCLIHLVTFALVQCLVNNKFLTCTLNEGINKDLDFCFLCEAVSLGLFSSIFPSSQNIFLISELFLQTFLDSLTSISHLQTLCFHDGAGHRLLLCLGLFFLRQLETFLASISSDFSVANQGVVGI